MYIFAVSWLKAEHPIAPCPLKVLDMWKDNNPFGQKKNVQANVFLSWSLRMRHKVDRGVILGFGLLKGFFVLIDLATNCRAKFLLYLMEWKEHMLPPTPLAWCLTHGKYQRRAKPVFSRLDPILEHCCQRLLASVEWLNDGRMFDLGEGMGSYKDKSQTKMSLIIEKP